MPLDPTLVTESAELSTSVGLGRVSARSARFWLRIPDPSPHWLTVRGPVGDPLVRALPARPASSDHTIAWTLPSDAAGRPPLRPSTAYRWQVVAAGGRPVAAGHFVTMPDAEDVDGEVRFAVLGCRRPSGNGDSGRDVDGLVDALRASRPNAVFLFMDATLADDVAATGVAGAAQHVRRACHARYRAMFGARTWRTILDEFPCVPVASGVHGPIDATADGRCGALSAYVDYLASRVTASPPGAGPFHFRMRSGPVAVFGADFGGAIDARARHPLLGAAQATAFERFLANSGDARLLLVLGAGWLGASGIGGDRRTTSREATWRERAWLRERLAAHRAAHPDQAIVAIDGSGSTMSQVEHRSALGRPVHELTMASRDAVVAGRLSAAPESFVMLTCMADPRTRPAIEVVTAAVRRATRRSREI